MVVGEREMTQLHEQQKPHRVHPNFILATTLNSASGIVVILFGAKGPNLTISTACSFNPQAIGQTMLGIRSGQADVMIAAGAEAGLVPLFMMVPQEDGLEMAETMRLTLKDAGVTPA